jgi:hypothetical protein
MVALVSDRLSAMATAILTISRGPDDDPNRAWPEAQNTQSAADPAERRQTTAAQRGICASASQIGRQAGDRAQIRSLRGIQDN